MSICSRCSACRLHLIRASLLYLTIVLFSWSLRMEVPYRTAILPSVLSANMVCPTNLLKDCCSSANYGTFSVKVTFLTIVSCSKFDACTLSFLAYFFLTDFFFLQACCFLQSCYFFQTCYFLWACGILQARCFLPAGCFFQACCFQKDCC